MNRTEKETLVAELQGQLKGVPALVLADFTGLDVEKTSLLRRKFREAGVTYRVVKNKLMRQAIKGTPHDAMSPLLKKPSSFCWNATDPSAAAKVLLEFKKTTENLRIKGGVLEGQKLDANGVEALATMPGRGELQAMVVGQALSPGRNVAGLIKGPGGKLKSQIEALVKKLEKNA